MRLAYLPLNDDEFPGGTNMAFRRRLGNENVIDIDYLALRRAGHGDDAINRHILARIIQFRPHVVHAQLQETGVVRPETLRQIAALPWKPVLTIWMGDCRVSVPDYTAAVSRECDLVLVSNIGQIPMYEAATGRQVVYWQIGVDWDRDFDITSKPNPISDRIPEVVFSGRYYGEKFPDSPERLAVVEACAKAFDFCVVGSGFPSHIPCIGERRRDEQRWIYAKAMVSVGVGNFNHVERFYSERQLQAMASGTPHACWRIPGLECEFTDMVDCAMFDSPDHAVEVIKKLLADDVLRGRIGKSGRERVLKEHTWDVRINEYMGLVEPMVKARHP